jgi:hypothetical protein
LHAATWVIRPSRAKGPVQNVELGAACRHWRICPGPLPVNTLIWPATSVMAVIVVIGPSVSKML